MARAEGVGEWQRKEFRSDIPRGGGASPEGGTGSSGQHGEEYLVDEGRGIRCAILATAVTWLKSRFAGEALAWPFRPAAKFRMLHVTGTELAGADLWMLSAQGHASSNCWFLPLSVLACLALPRANTFCHLFYIPSHATRISLFLFHFCPLITSSLHTLGSISLFTPLRLLGPGRFTRFPTRLPAYYLRCQYYSFPPTPSRKHESHSRVPWPYISATKMSSSEDDKPLVKGSFSHTHMHAFAPSGVTCGLLS
jgi:hypothetical protein